MQDFRILKLCYRKYIQNKSKHRCQLPQPEDIIVNYIEAGCLIPLRRTIKQQFLVNPSNPRSRMFLKSNTKIKEEKARHLQHYYYIIHPFSTARACWEFFMMVIFLISLFLIPFQIFLAEYYKAINNFRFSIDCFCLTDVVINFWTGYFNTHTKQIILSPKKIAIHYLCGFFIIDLISSLPFYKLTNDIDKLAYLKFVRLITCTRYMERLKDWRGYSNFSFLVVRFILVFFMVILWFASIIFVYTQSIEPALHGNPEPEIIAYHTIHSFYRSCYVLLLCGYDGLAIYVMGTYLIILGILLGVVMQLYCIGNVLLILSKFNSSGRKYQQIIQELDEYSRHKGLPDRMRSRLVQFFENKYRRRYYKEQELFATISSQLREEISLVTFRRFIDKVGFFSELPTNLMITVINTFKSVFYLPNDVLVQAGQIGDALYLISYGRVAVYNAAGEELAHMGDGDHFGEMGLVMEERRQTTVIAVDPCELYRLTRNEFKKIMENYPDLMASVRLLAQDSIYNVTTLGGATSSSGISL